MAPFKTWLAAWIAGSVSVLALHSTVWAQTAPGEAGGDSLQSTFWMALLTLALLLLGLAALWIARLRRSLQLVSADHDRVISDIEKIEGFFVHPAEQPAEAPVTDEQFAQNWQQMATRIAATTGFPIVMIELYERAAQRLTLAAAEGVRAEPGTAAALDGTLAGRVIGTLEPAIEMEARSRSETVHPALQRAGAHCVMCLPLVVQRQAIGVLTLASTTPCEVDGNQQRLARILASFVSMLHARMPNDEAAEGERRLSRMLLGSSSDGIFAFDTQCRYTFWNAAMERIHRLSQSEVLGRSVFDVFPHLRESGQMRRYTEALAGQNLVTTDDTFDLPGGRLIDCEVSYSPLHDAWGEVIGGMGVMRDITERTRTTESLRESEARFRHLFTRAPVAMWGEELTGVARWLKELRQKDVINLRMYLQEHPRYLLEAASLIRVQDVNKAALSLFEADNKQQFVLKLGQIFDQRSLPARVEQLVAIWENRPELELEVPASTLGGRQLNLRVQWSIPPRRPGADTLHVVIAVTDHERGRGDQDAASEPAGPVMAKL